MKASKRPLRFWVIAGVSLVLVLLAVVAINLPRPQLVSNATFNLAALADGAYTGACNNGLVSAKVEVAVQDHAIADVRILEHRNGMGKAAESIVDTVTAQQSLEVDTVSGATLSSQTILKAIENALSK